MCFGWTVKASANVCHLILLEVSLLLKVAFLNRFLEDRELSNDYCLFLVHDIRCLEFSTWIIFGEASGCEDPEPIVCNLPLPYGYNLYRQLVHG